MIPFLSNERRMAHKLKNKFHTIALIVGIGFIMTFCAWLIAGLIGVAVALCLVGLFSYFIPVLSGATLMKIYKAKEVDSKHGRQLMRLVELLSDRAELVSTPKLYVIPSATLNAFATGTPENPVIAITEGLLRKLKLKELRGVLAHEMSHIRNNDLRIMGIADIMSRITQLMSYIGLFLILLNIPLLFLEQEAVPWSAALMLYATPIFSSLLQLALSRAREYDADLEAVHLTGDAQGLIDALQKLEHYQGKYWEDILLPGRRIPQPSLLRSHPPTDDRIARLRDLRPQMPELAVVEEPMITMIGYGPATLYPRFHWPWPGIWY